MQHKTTMTTYRCKGVYLLGITDGVRVLWDNMDNMDNVFTGCERVLAVLVGHKRIRNDAECWVFAIKG